ncbi:MAG: glycosyltransferase family 9 protein [Planctomycetota bacterium]
MPPTAPSRIQNPRRILIVRPSALGDVARTVPCVVSLRRAYPEATIDWLVDARYADVIRHHPDLNDVVLFHRKNLGTVGPLLYRLRRARYDLTVDLRGLARSGFFAWTTRAPRRVGYANAREFGWLGLNRRHHIDRALHAVPRMLGLLEAEGIPPVGNLTLHVGAEDAAWRDGFLAEHGLLPGGYACIAPTARWGCKCWPIERFVEIAESLMQHPALGGRVVVLADSRERSRVRPLLARLGDQAVFPDTQVGQLMALIQTARLLIGTDSAPLHLAVGLDTPTVSVFGPTDPALVGPPSPEYFTQQPDGTRRAIDLHRVLRAPSAVGQTINYRRHREDDALIAEVQTDAVWRAIGELFEQTAG